MTSLIKRKKIRLGKLQQRIVKELRMKRGITIREIQQQTKLDYRYIQEALWRLQARDLVWCVQSIILSPNHHSQSTSWYLNG